MRTSRHGLKIKTIKCKCGLYDYPEKMQDGLCRQCQKKVNKTNIPWQQWLKKQSESDRKWHSFFERK